MKLISCFKTLGLNKVGETHTMKSKVSLTVVLLAVVGLGAYFSITSIMESSYSKYEDVIISAKNKSPSPPTQPTDNDSIELPTVNHEQYLEIELTADDIYEADSKGIIGVSEPFNSDFITRVDVINSIKKIGNGIIEYDAISPKYQKEFLTLRHVEMVEGVLEKDSTLHTALKEYAEKILPIELQQGDNTKSNDTMSSDSELGYKADVSIAETEGLLSGGK